MNVHKPTFLVQWNAAIGYEHPDLRAVRYRRFGSLADAAAQVRSLQRWPEHVEILGVWTVPAPAERIELDALPAPSEHVSDLEGEPWMRK